MACMHVPQVLGITNYSHWGDAAPLRSCVWESNHAHDLLEQVALKRIKRFVHVGTTDKLFDSAASAAVSACAHVSRRRCDPVRTATPCLVCE